LSKKLINRQNRFKNVNSVSYYSYSWPLIALSFSRFEAVFVLLAFALLFFVLLGRNTDEVDAEEVDEYVADFTDGDFDTELLDAIVGELVLLTLFTLGLFTVSTSSWFVFVLSKNVVEF